MPKISSLTFCLAASKKRDLKDDRDSNRTTADFEPGAFANYPEVTAQTITKLKENGINALFPIQQGCFKPIYSR